MNYSAQLKELFEETIKSQASDLHLSAGDRPTLRINGVLIPLAKRKILSPEETQGFATALMTEDQIQRFLKEKELDFSYNFEDRARFRVNVYLQKGAISIALRLIPAKIRTIEELNLPPILHQFCQPQQGFVLVTGPSGHGKSTTLAALIDEINHTRQDHIITIEDPIEYVFQDDQAIIDQREVYQDTLSFARALRATFRQDPDVIMVGEMRDLETMATAITAAETGHLVFATLHTNNASQTIHRIVDSFPPAQQTQIRNQLAGSLLGVLSQRLIPRIKGGLIPACEIMFNTPAVANLIRENKIHEIDLVIETSAEIGMISLNRYLATLVKQREVSFENAINYSLNPAELRILVRK
jgi:twitching motility protein PilT